MKIVHVAGCRPQFVKLAMVDRELRSAGHESVILHTGQHYDEGMSEVFFRQLEIPAPKINLGVGSGSHAEQVGKAMIGIEKFLLEEKPDGVLVYGDTNATMAGILAACKLGIKTAHVEAGMRSFDRNIPEEYNRVVTDHCSDLLFCVTENSRSNLEREGIISGVYLVGDIMLDTFYFFLGQQTDILNKLEIEPKRYLLATAHRSTLSRDDIANIFAALETLDETVIFPLHPRMAALVPPHGSKIRTIDPIGYLDMITLENNARMILTDSGGVQREAYFSGVPCVILRDETEWTDITKSGWNVVAGTGSNKIFRSVRDFVVPAFKPPIFGDGQTRKQIVKHLQDNWDTK